MTIRRSITWLRRGIIGGGLGFLWGSVAMWVLGISVFSIAFIGITALALGMALGRFYMYYDGNVVRFWPMRIRRHCYDKPHRCPGWAGGGRKVAPPEQTICTSGSFAPDMYERRLWRWRVHTCAQCGTVALPIVVKYLDPFYWVLWRMPSWKRSFVLWRMGREEDRALWREDR